MLMNGKTEETYQQLKKALENDYNTRLTALNTFFGKYAEEKLSSEHEPHYSEPQYTISTTEHVKNFVQSRGKGAFTVKDAIRYLMDQRLTPSRRKPLTVSALLSNLRSEGKLKVTDQVQSPGNSRKMNLYVQA